MKTLVFAFTVFLVLAFTEMDLDSKEKQLKGTEPCVKCCVLIYKSGSSSRSITGMDPFGTGFFYRPEKNGKVFLFTAKHIATSKDPLYISFTPETNPDGYSAGPVNGSGTEAPKSFCFTDDKLDLGLIPLDTFLEKTGPPLFPPIEVPSTKM